MPYHSKNKIMFQNKKQTPVHEPKVKVEINRYNQKGHNSKKMRSMKVR